MKRAMTIVVVVAVALLASTAVYAWWGDYGPGYGAAYSNVDNMKKFQKETLSLRDELMTKRIELQNEYGKSTPDSSRIVTLKKEIIDLQAKIQDVAAGYNIPAGGYMGDMPGRGWGRGMYSYPGCGCRL